MNQRTARLDSYFSLPTDLAAEMRTWVEFVSGDGYSVKLQSAAEQVSVKLVPPRADDPQHVVVAGQGLGSLFERVLGCAVYSLSAHSDSVWVAKWDQNAV